MRQQLVETQVLGHRERIKLHEACESLLSTSKESGAYSTLVTATNRDLSRWVEYERKRGIQDITIRLWSRQLNKICRNANRLDYYTPSHNLRRKTLATRLLSRGAAITDVQPLLGHASVKTTEKAYMDSSSAASIPFYIG